MTDTSEPRPSTAMSRRRFLQLAGIGASAPLVAPLMGLGSHAGAGRDLRPLIVLSGQERVIDSNLRVSEIRVEQGGVLRFAPNRSARVESLRSAEIRGKLVMKPDRHSVTHSLVFPAVREALFRGGGMAPIATDIGLWVVGRGVADLAGSPKLAWSRAEGAGRGDSRITLKTAPKGWRRGDQLVVTPTAPPTTPDHHLAYDVRRIASIKGHTVRLSKPLSHNHPEVEVGRGIKLGPEVLNLTRNVRIKGSRGGRAHFFIHSAKPQRISHLALRFMGPRQPDGSHTRPVLGRYGLHFHHMHHDSHGSVVDSVVVRDAGSHSFVSHESHGVTFRECISHNTFNEAYWADAAADPRKAPGSNDTLYDRCVASLVKSDPPFRGYRLTGFSLGPGRRNSARGCVATGVQGNKNASGFLWPGSSGGVWTFKDCVSHNNDVHGLFVWQNSKENHVVTDFIAYHNGDSGISHGAYRNRYVYKNSILYGNRESAIRLHAASLSDGRLRFTNFLCDSAGISDYAVVATMPNLEPLAPTLFARSTFKGFKRAAIAIQGGGAGQADQPQVIDFLNCDFRGKELWLEDDIVKSSRLRIRDRKRGSIVVRRSDTKGRLVKKWNARVRRIK